MTKPNAFTTQFEEDDGGGVRRTKLGHQAGCRDLGLSVYEIDPGGGPWGYHFHWANEEMLLVLEGQPTLRSPEGSRTLRAGDVVSFRRGPDGGHQIANDGEARVRILILSELNYPEVVVYPDSGIVGALTRAPGSRSVDGEVIAWFRRDQAVDYGEVR
jgi:uncharacterized cupin superfamily protein